MGSEAELLRQLQDARKAIEALAASAPEPAALARASAYLASELESASKDIHVRHARAGLGLLAG